MKKSTLARTFWSVHSAPAGGPAQCVEAVNRWQRRRANILWTIAGTTAAVFRRVKKCATQFLVNGNEEAPTRAELRELRMLLDSQAEALTQVIEKTANLSFMVRTAIDEARAEVQKERQINALQNEALQTLVFLSERPTDEVGHVPAYTEEFYATQWKKLSVLVRWLRNQPSAVQVGAAEAAGAPAALEATPEPVESE